jgi:nitroreductase
MTTTLVDVMATHALRRAAARAALAPSVHNTQPWRFVIRDGALEVHADAARRLAVLDPTGRQMLVSCGCAVFNARATLDNLGYAAAVELMPDGPESTLVARLAVAGPAEPGPIGTLEPMIELRQTNRRRFDDGGIDDEFRDVLTLGAAAEGGQLTYLRHLDQRLAVARLTQHADREQNADPAYRAELRDWTTSDIERRDGVPSFAVPHAGAGSHDDVPIRDFDSAGDGALPTETDSSMCQSMAILATPEDNPYEWVRGGEALERVWLEVVRRGFTMSLFTQTVEVPWIRESLRGELQMAGYPYVVLRIGRAARTPETRRRPLADVLTEPGDAG